MFARFTLIRQHSEEKSDVWRPPTPPGRRRRRPRTTAESLSRWVACSTGCWFAFGVRCGRGWIQITTTKAVNSLCEKRLSRHAEAWMRIEKCFFFDGAAPRTNNRQQWPGGAAARKDVPLWFGCGEKKTKRSNASMQGIRGDDRLKFNESLCGV